MKRAQGVLDEERTGATPCPINEVSQIINNISDRGDYSSVALAWFGLDCEQYLKYSNLSSFSFQVVEDQASFALNPTKDKERH